MTDEPKERHEARTKVHARGNARSFAEVRLLLAADLFRYAGRIGLVPFLKNFLFTPGYKYTVWMRLCGYLAVRKVTRYTLYPLVKFLLLRCRYRYGIAIPEYTDIGPGFFINRFGGIYIHGDVVMGENVNITSGTMIGMTNRGPRQGVPTLGNCVFLAHSAKLIGQITVGDAAAVAVNAVVTHDVPQGAVVGGIPARRISGEGSEGYINNQVPAALMERCRRARAAGGRPPLPRPAARETGDRAD